MSKKKDSTKKPSFEESLDRLTDSVRQLEAGNLTLDESLACYENGIRYLSQCRRILSRAERKIQTLSGFDADGNPVLQENVDQSMSLEEKAENRSQRRTARRPKRKPAAPDDTETKVIRYDNPATDDVDDDGLLF